MSDMNQWATPAHITPQQREIVLCLANGMTVKQAAQHLNVSLAVARGRVRQLRINLDVRTTGEIPTAYQEITGENPYEAAAWLA